MLDIFQVSQRFPTPIQMGEQMLLKVSRPQRKPSKRLFTIPGKTFSMANIRPRPLEVWDDITYYNGRTGGPALFSRGPSETEELSTAAKGRSEAKIIVARVGFSCRWTDLCLEAVGRDSQHFVDKNHPFSSVPA